MDLHQFASSHTADHGPIDHIRRTPRVALRAEVGFGDDTNFYVGFTENVSEGGLFVETYTPVAIGTEVDLTFVIPGMDGDQSVSCTGVVRWVRDLQDLRSETSPGLGIEFTQLSDDARAIVERYVERSAPMFFPD